MINQDVRLQQIISEERNEETVDDMEGNTNPPPNWRIVPLGQVYSFTKKPKKFRYAEFEQIPFVPMDLLPVGRMFFDRFLLKEAEKIPSGTYFESGDILLAKITPSFENGKQGIIEELPTPFGVATTEVIPIKEVEGISNKCFLFYYLLRRSIRATLASKMEGSTGRQRLSIPTLASLEIFFPPLIEQQTIAQVLQIVQEATQARRQEINLEYERQSALLE